MSCRLLMSHSLYSSLVLLTLHIKYCPHSLPDYNLLKAFITSFTLVMVSRATQLPGCNRQVSSTNSIYCFQNTILSKVCQGLHANGIAGNRDKSVAIVIAGVVALLPVVLIPHNSASLTPKKGEGQLAGPLYRFIHTGQATIFESSARLALR